MPYLGLFNFIGSTALSPLQLRTFPEEVLSQIFRQTMVDDMWNIVGHGQCLPAVSLAGVCVEWRRIVVENPKYWNHICLRLTPFSTAQVRDMNSTFPEARLGQIIRGIFFQSKNRPLDVWLDISTPDRLAKRASDSFELFVHTVLEVLFSSSCRWRSFKFTITINRSILELEQGLENTFQKLSDRLYRLEHLDIPKGIGHWFIPLPPSPMLMGIRSKKIPPKNHLPNLKTLVLRGPSLQMNPRLEHIPFAQLTELQLVNTDNPISVRTNWVVPDPDDDESDDPTELAHKGPLLIAQDAHDLQFLRLCNVYRSIRDESAMVDDFCTNYAHRIHIDFDLRRQHRDAFILERLVVPNLSSLKLALVGGPMITSTDPTQVQPVLQKPEFDFPIPRLTSFLSRSSTNCQKTLTSLTWENLPTTADDFLRLLRHLPAIVNLEITFTWTDSARIDWVPISNHIFDQLKFTVATGSLGEDNSGGEGGPLVPRLQSLSVVSDDKEGFPYETFWEMVVARRRVAPLRARVRLLDRPKWVRMDEINALKKAEVDVQLVRTFVTSPEI